ncbi:MAG TPA: glycosyl hydrolase [Sorangium sp.]|nr:glycosyl hydrolase [Sorangium sp.]
MRGPGTSTLRIALGAALAAVGQPSPAGAQEARAAATCPAREALLTAVDRLVSASGRAAAADGDIEVRDLGDRYSVTVLGYTRVYVDEARDCAARAQNAAVFAALTLYPPDIEAPRRAAGPRPDPARLAAPPPSPAPPSPLPAPAPPAPVTVSGPVQPAAGGHSVAVELGVFGADAPATSGAFALGADASVAVAWPSVGVAFGGAFASASTLELGATRVRLRHLDRTARELTRLKEAHVPVIWRPFHELDGGWFWWSKEGPDQFKKLWTLMFDYYTDTYHLDNLIWVLGFDGEPDGAWYPGDEYVDIAGADTYGGMDSKKAMYEDVASIVGDEMPICYHECDPIPDPDAVVRDGVDWVVHGVAHRSPRGREPGVSPAEGL